MPEFTQKGSRLYNKTVRRGIPSGLVSSREDLLFEKIAIFEGDSDNRVIREALTDTHLPFEDEGEVQDILEEFRDKGLIK